MANLNELLLASIARTTTTSSASKVNYGYKGGHIVVSVTSVPGVDTVTPIIEAYDPELQVYYELLTGRSMDDTGVQVLKIYPGINTIINGSCSDLLPLMWRLRMVHSGLGNFVYAVSASLIA